MEPTIVAMGGGQEANDPAFGYIARLLDARRPKVCLLPTAASAVPVAVLWFLTSFPTDRFEPTFLDLFARDGRDLRTFLLSQDAIIVGGGNTANLLAIWRLHGVDAILREAWEAGVVLAGASAGANCWFEACTTDSFGPLAPLTDGLGLLGGSFCPHYDSEPGRRPLYHELIADGFPSGIACDDLAAVHWAGSEIAAVVASHPDARAYRVTTGPEGVAEEPLPARLVTAG